MYERIVEIIVYLLTELKVKNDISKINLDRLSIDGYTDAEISTALSWIIDRIEFQDKLTPFEKPSSPLSFRILHEGEKELFTPDAWGELISMHSLGIIGNENIEALIDRSMMIGMKQIDKQTLKLFVANTIYNIQHNNMLGSRFMLQGNDTVN